MSKGPLIAVAVSIIAAVIFFLFADIRPPKSQPSDVVVEHSIDIDPIAYIESFNEGLNEADRLYIDSLLLILISNEATAKDVDAVIRFYEQVQQYNFSAWFHTRKAQIENSPESWSLAGSRQYSVSQNDAYEEDFNRLLRVEALKSYQTAISMDSSNLDTRVKLAACYLDKSEETMQGVTMLLEVVSEDSMHVNANILLGRFGIVSSQYDKAIKRLENVLSLQPENTEALFLLGEAYQGVGNTEKAVEVLLKCRDLIENEQLKKELDAYIMELQS
jgi:outer membrane protein